MNMRNKDLQQKIKNLMYDIDEYGVQYQLS